MADALTIDFALTNFDKVSKAFQALEKLSQANSAALKSVEAAASHAADAYRALNAQVEKFNRLSGGSGRAGAINIGRGAGPSSSSGGRAASFVSGPFQRQAALAQQAMQASAIGNTRASADIAIAQATNDKRIARISAGSGGVGAKIMDALKTSRLSIGAGGGQLMPLAGKVAGIAAEALGPEVLALANPVSALVAALAAAGTGLFNLTKSAAEAGTAFASFQAATGGFGKSGAAAEAIGKMGGLSAEGTAGQVNSLQQTITGSAMGRLMGEHLGVFNLPGMYGNQDYASLYVKAIETARKIKDPSQRLMIMRGAGIEGSFGATQISDKQFGYMKGDAAVKDKIMNPAFLTQSLDFQNSLSRVSDAWQNLIAALGKPALKMLTDDLNILATGINKFALAVDSPAFKAVIATAFPVTDTVTKGLAALGSHFSGNVSSDPNLDATDQNTKALEKLTGAIDGQYGSDPQGRRAAAFPDAAGYGALAQSRSEYVSSGLRLGAF